MLARHLVADLEQHHGPFHLGRLGISQPRDPRHPDSELPQLGPAIDLDTPSNPIGTNPVAGHTIGS